jgi:hypothetical protein
LKIRDQARREAEALRPEAERLVDRLSAQMKDLTEVVTTLKRDLALGEALRHAALRVVLRKAQGDG